MNTQVVTTRNKSVPLGEVARFIRGITFKPYDPVAIDESDAIVCMRTKNVQVDLDEDDLIALPKSFVRREEQFLQSGDLLVSSANSWNLVGKCCWIPDLSYRATAGGFISILRASPSRILPRYLYYWFSHRHTQELVRMCGRQTTNIANLDFRRCLALHIPLPPLEEQSRIVAILDKADAICRKHTLGLDHFGNLARNAFLHFFGDPLTNPHNWPIGTIRQLVSQVQYGTSKKAGPTGRRPMLRMNNITSAGDLDISDLKYVDLENGEHDRFMVTRGDLLFNRTNSKELVGKTAIYDRDEEMAFAGYLIRVRTNQRAQPEFIWGYLNSSHGKMVLTGICKHIIGMANINAQELQNIPIFIPPIKTQTDFAKLITTARAARRRYLRRCVDATLLFDSLIQRAFQSMI